eukprot:FR736236.1.p2 GENE.FR736236.1~~FR736236.1.p2  ORF type:complete len:127 (-),score=35.27 FR736236.1:483-863(-)
MPMFPPSGQLTPIKGNKKLELHGGGGRSRTSGSLWLWTLAVTHCGRFFFFFFFFFFFVSVVLFRSRIACGFSLHHPRQPASLDVSPQTAAFGYTPSELCLLLDRTRLRVLVAAAVLACDSGGYSSY